MKCNSKGYLASNFKGIKNTNCWTYKRYIFEKINRIELLAILKLTFLYYYNF